MEVKNATHVAMSFGLSAASKDTLSLVPQGIIVGTIEKGANIFTTFDDREYLEVGEYCEDLTQNVYGFPIEIESLLEYFNSSKNDVSSMTIEECCAKYVAEIQKDTYIAKKREFNEYQVYRIDGSSFEVSEVDILSNFYEADQERLVVSNGGRIGVIGFEDVSQEESGYSYKSGTHNNVSVSKRESLEKKDSEPSLIILPNRKSVYDEITSSVMFQDEAVQQILRVLYMNRKFGMIFPRMHRNMFVQGMSGHGKTEILVLAKDLIKIPIVFVDSTQFTKTGYVGRPASSVLTDLLELSDRNVEIAEQGVVFLDEADKWAQRGRDDFVSTVGVQEDFLNLMDGKVTSVPKQTPSGYYVPSDVYINTRNITFIFGGACEGIFDKYNKKRSGFGESRKLDQDGTLKRNELTEKDLRDYGFGSQLIRRWQSIVTLNPLGKDEVVQILLKSKISDLKIHEAALESMGVALRYDLPTVDAIASKALKSAPGAAALKKVVCQTLDPMMDEVEASPGVYSKAIITPETVSNPYCYQLKR